MNLQAILEEQNPWWRDPAQRGARRFPVRRDLQGDLLRRLTDLEDRRAIVLLGPRQVGKTTLFLQTADDLLGRGLPPGNLTYFDFSDDRVTRPVSAREVAEKLPVGHDPDRPRVLLLDEVRLAPNWGRWLKSAVDRGGARIAVTDSAASILREASRESGQGRWDEYRIETLSYREFARLQGAPDEMVETIWRRMPNLLERYLARGGFPEHARSEDLPLVRRRLRSDVVERALLRDLAKHVERIEPVRDLFVYLMQDSGAIWNAKSRSNDMGCDERSVRKWVRLLEDTFLVASLPRRAARASSSLRSHPKLYAADHGLIAAFSTGPRDEPPVRGRIFEAAVFRHLRETARVLDGELSYFRPRQGLETDFVLTTEDGRIVVEVTSSRTLKPRKLERVARATAELDADRALLVYGGLIGETVAEKVVALPLERFLRDPRGSLGEPRR